MNRIKKGFAGGTALAFLVALVLTPIPAAYAEDDPGASSETVAVDTTTTDETASAAEEEAVVVEDAESTEEATPVVEEPVIAESTPEEVIPYGPVVASALRVAPASSGGNGGANNTNETTYWENLYSNYNAVCYKHDYNGGAHGTVVGKEVQLNPFGADWYGNGYVVLIVNGGSNDAVYEFPVPGDQNYVSPLNGGGNIPDVSHWIVCKGDIPEVEPLVATAPLTVTPATCDTGEILNYSDEDAENASFTEESTPSGTEGPADYNVVAIADEGAEFKPGITKLVWEDELAGPITGPECDEIVVPKPVVTLTGSATCDVTTGTYTITWDGLITEYGTLSEVDLKVINHLPAGTLINGVDAQVWLYEWIEHNANHGLTPFPADGEFSFTQSGVSGSATSASVTVQYDFKGGPSGDPEGTIKLDGDCEEVTDGTQTATVVGQCVPADDETDGGPIALLDFFNTFDVTKPFYVFANGELYNAEPVLVPANSSVEDSVIGFNEGEYGGSVVISIYDGSDPLTANLLAEATVDTDCVTDIVTIPVPPALELVGPTCDAAGSIKGIENGLPHGEGWTTEMNPAFTGAGTYLYRFVTDGDIPFVGGLTATEWVELVVAPQKTEGCPSTTTVVNTEEPFPGVDLRLLGLAAGAVVLAMFIAGLIALLLVRSKRRGQTA